MAAWEGSSLSSHSFLADTHRMAPGSLPASRAEETSWKHTGRGTETVSPTTRCDLRPVRASLTISLSVKPGCLISNTGILPSEDCLSSQRPKPPQGKCQDITMTSARAQKQQPHTKRGDQVLLTGTQMSVTHDCVFCDTFSPNSWELEVVLCSNQI